MWNAETAQFLHDWYATPEGTYAITQENRLFQHLISQWPRRGHTLLDIGCGAGIFLEMLWHYGFDVTGLDTGTDLLDMARERLGNRAEFQLGRPEHLPFDDEEFDYAALLTVLEYVDNPEDVLREAIRVSHRGVIIGFMGALLGVGLGLLVLEYRMQIQGFLAGIGFDPFPVAFHGTANIPVVIDWAELAWQAVKAFVMVVVASIIPALITARQDPARSLRSM